MKHPTATTRGIIALCAVVTLAACEQPVAPSSASIRPGIPLAVSGDKIAIASSSTNQKVDVTGTMDSPCTGEPIAYDGSIHIVTTMSQTADGVTMKYHMNTGTFHAVGLVTGAKYNMIQVMKEDADLVLPGNESGDIAWTYRIISQGSLDNFAADVVYSFSNAPVNVTYKARNLRCEG